MTVEDESAALALPDLGVAVRREQQHERVVADVEDRGRGVLREGACGRGRGAGGVIENLIVFDASSTREADGRNSLLQVARKRQGFSLLPLPLPSSPSPFFLEAAGRHRRRSPQAPRCPSPSASSYRRGHPAPIDGAVLLFSTVICHRRSSIANHIP
jgi:hypothetical protein